MNRWAPLAVRSGGGFDVTSRQVLDLTGWSVMVVVASVLLIYVFTQFGAVKRAADRGMLWPAINSVTQAWTAWYLCGQIPVPESSNLPISSTAALLGDIVTSLGLMLRVIAYLMLVLTVCVALYGLVRWVSTEGKVAGWGPLTPTQILFAKVRLRARERHLAALLAASSGAQTRWWIERRVTPPTRRLLLPTVETWLMTTDDVDDVAAIKRAAAALPMVAEVETSTCDDDAPRLRVHWDVEALAFIGPAAAAEGRRAPRSRWAGSRGVPPAPVIAGDPGVPPPGSRS